MTRPLTTTGLHHVSVLAADAPRNLAFWTRTMGQRLIKRTVNYDAPSMHHLYYGDGEGGVGATLTFFPIPHAAPSTLGTGETVAVAYAVRPDALPAWRERLESAGVPVRDADRWDRPVLAFRDPDGLPVELVGVAEPPPTPGWPDEPVPASMRLHGFESVTLRLASADATLELLDAMGYAPVAERTEGRGRRLRLATGAGVRGEAIELVEEGRPLPGRDGRGTVHHVAFRLPDEAAQLRAREALLAMGLRVSEVRDRDYFRSIYVREPGGVLFEFATDGPGMTVDEPLEALGSALRVPAWAEPDRAAIEAGLPPLGLDARAEDGATSDPRSGRDARANEVPQ
jgi:glyoxalase family protein